jgi:hypothetical protein
MSNALWEDGLVNFTDLLQSIAHVLEFGPFTPETEAASPSFTFDPHETHIWTHYKKLDATAKQAFNQVASFFSRAYNQDLPAESESTDQEDLQQARESSILAITGLLNLHRPKLLGREHAAEWDIGEVLAQPKTRRALAMEERRWADKLAEVCNLEFLKFSRKAQIKPQNQAWKAV